MTASPYLGSGSRIVCPPASVPPASRTLDEAPREDLGEHVARQVLGERGDREGEQDPATHREDVGEGVGRGDLAERARVVDERREEVERADDREVVADPVGGGVVGRVEPRDQRRVGRCGGLGAQTAERVGEQVRPELRGATRRSRSARSGGAGSPEERRASSPSDDTGGPRPRARGPAATIAPGAVGSRWVPWSSKPVARRSARRGGFDSHAFPPRRPDAVQADRAPATPERRARPRRDPSPQLGRWRAIRYARRRGRAARSTRSGRAWPMDGRRARSAPWPTTCVARLERVCRLRGPLPVINATGVIVHTNLGRAPWPKEVARGGRRRAPRATCCSSSTARPGGAARAFRDGGGAPVALTGAEDALVTNNNAAALALAVGLAGRGGVVVSRGELVEIGGGVRIPEIIRRAGARLIEVGTTNRTRAADFEAPLAEGKARAVLRVHPSNFTMAGFTEAPDPADGRRARPSPRGDRHRRPGLWRPARHGRVRPGPRADAGGTAGGRLGRRHVQRRQAGRRPAGGTRRRAGRPGRPDAPGPAGPRDAPRQGDAGRRRRDPRPVPRRPGGGRRSRSGG